MEKLTVKKVAKKVGETAKEVEETVNPLAKKIDKNTTTDTGAESIKFSRQTVKTADKSVKTAKSTVKTTKTAVKTTVKVANAVVHPKRTAVKVVRKTAKAVVTTVRTVKNVVTTVVAIATNPIVWVIILVLLMLMMLFNMVTLILGGADTNQKAVSQPVGLGDDIATAYKDGYALYEKALDKRKKEFEDAVDNRRFDTSDLEHSDLIYVKRLEPTVQEYQKSYATDRRKNDVKTTWELPITEKNEIMAIAYVYAELLANKDKESYLDVYEIEFTEDFFNDFIDQYIPFSKIETPNQECLLTNCIRDPEKWKIWNDHEREYFLPSYNGFNEFVGIYNYVAGFDDLNAISGWLEQVVHINWYNVYGEVFPKNTRDLHNRNDYGRHLEYCGRIYEEHKDIANRLWSEYENSTACGHNHTLHSIGIAFYEKDDLLDKLGFDDNYKEWVELIKQGLDSSEELEDKP